MDEWMDGWIYGYMDVSMDGCIFINVLLFYSNSLI